MAKKAIILYESRFSHSSFPKTTDLKTSTKVWIKSAIFPNDYRADLSVTWFLKLECRFVQHARMSRYSSYLVHFQTRVFWSYRLEFFRQGLSRECFVNIGFFVVVICLMINQPFLSHMTKYIAVWLRLLLLLMRIICRNDQSSRKMNELNCAYDCQISFFLLCVEWRSPRASNEVNNPGSISVSAIF